MLCSLGALLWVEVREGRGRQRTGNRSKQGCLDSWSTESSCQTKIKRRSSRRRCRRSLRRQDRPRRQQQQQEQPHLFSGLRLEQSGSRSAQTVAPSPPTLLLLPRREAAAGAAAAPLTHLGTLRDHLRRRFHHRCCCHHPRLRCKPRKTSSIIIALREQQRLQLQLGEAEGQGKERLHP